MQIEAFDRTEHRTEQHIGAYSLRNDCAERRWIHSLIQKVQVLQVKVNK